MSELFTVEINPLFFNQDLVGSVFVPDVARMGYYPSGKDVTRELVLAFERGLPSRDSEIYELGADMIEQKDGSQRLEFKYLGITYAMIILATMEQDNAYRQKRLEDIQEQEALMVGPDITFNDEFATRANLANLITGKQGFLRFRSSPCRVAYIPKEKQELATLVLGFPELFDVSNAEPELDLLLTPVVGEVNAGALAGEKVNELQYQGDKGRIQFIVVDPDYEGIAAKWRVPFCVYRELSENQLRP